MKGEGIQCLGKHTTPNTLTLALRLFRGRNKWKRMSVCRDFLGYSLADFSGQVYLCSFEVCIPEVSPGSAQAHLAYNLNLEIFTSSKIEKFFFLESEE